jgi:copper homeostasis protein
VIVIEAAIDSLADAERAVAEGAHRLEVCARLDIGGTTPPVELLRGCLALGVPCAAMIRPRGGDFVYRFAEPEQIRADAQTCREAGAQGLVVGMLTAGGAVEEGELRRFVERNAGYETVFHRAFDHCADMEESLETLISCGVTRVLTSGGLSDAVSGVDTLASLVKQAAGRIEILPGGGVRGWNVAEIVRRTGVSQVHARASEPGVIAGIVAALG